MVCLARRRIQSVEHIASGCHSTSASPFGPRTHQTNSSPQSRCQLNGFFVDKLRGKRLQSTPHTPGAKFTAALLGVSSDVNKFVTPRQPRPRPSLCKRLGEQPAFKLQCAARIAEMNAALAAAKGKRGLIIRFVGRGRWGIGHTLSHAFVLHYLCNRLRRYCYLELFDSELQRLFTYANGESWAPPAAAAVKYPGSVLEITLKKKFTSPLALYERLLNETAPLIRVKVLDGEPTVASDGLPWNLALVASASSRPSSSHLPGLTRDNNTVSKIDRCFCRYVSQPAFGKAGQAVLDANEQKIIASSSENGGLALHIRTGFADVSDHIMTRSHQTHASPVRQETAVWFRAACDPATFRRLPSAYVLSDALGLVNYLVDTFPQLYASKRLAWPQVTQIYGGSTRSWENGFDAKLMSVIDAVSAGFAGEVRFSRYSVMLKPVVARACSQDRTK
jgi:hypothetical protein